MMEQQVQEKKYIIDVDQVIEAYNKENPELKPLSRKILSELLNVNVQVFTDWKGGKTPKWVIIIFKLMDLGKCDVNKFIIEQKNE
jgi:hypothetical protein